MPIEEPIEKPLDPDTLTAVGSTSVISPMTSNFTAYYQQNHCAKADNMPVVVDTQERSCSFLYVPKMLHDGARVFSSFDHDNHD